MTPTSAWPPRRPSCSAEPVRRLKGPLAPPGSSGFTLIEVLIALGILALLAAVVMPGLARRLDLAYSDAELQQALSSASILPARVATLGIDLQLDAASLGKPLPDGQPPIDIPRGWTTKVEAAAKLSRTGSCEPGSLLLREPSSGRRWRLTYARLTCQLGVTALSDESP